MLLCLLPKKHIVTVKSVSIKQQLPLSDLNEKQIHATPAKKRPHLYCSRLGCHVNNVNTPSIRFHCIPVFPKDLPVCAHGQRYINREGIILLRKEIADWCHFKRRLKEGAYRFCEEHKFETVTKSIQLTWGNDKNGNVKQWTQSYELHVPVGAGPNSTMCLKTKDS
jgi:hypothetical protein